MANNQQPPSTGGGTLPNLGFPYGVISPTSVGDFNSLLQYALGQTHPNLPSFQDTIAQGMSSPIFQQILNPALANLVPGEELARQSLMDEFRSAGALAPNSGALAIAAPRLENALQQQRGNLISQTLANFLPQLVAGYGLQSRNAFEPANLIDQILGISKPTVISDTRANISNALSGSPQSNDPGNIMGTFNAAGGTGGGGGSGGSGGGGSGIDSMWNLGIPSYGPTNVGYGSTNPNNTYIDQYLKGYDPYSSMSFGDGGGGAGYGISYDPASGSYVSDPFSSGVNYDGWY